MSTTSPLSRPDISPELALVDPELRRIALLLLPEPGSLVPAGHPKPAPVTEAPQRPEPVVARRSRASVWSRRALVLTGAGAAFAVMLPSAVGLRAPPGPTLVTVDALASASPRTQGPHVENEMGRESGLDRARFAPAPRVARRMSQKKAASKARRPARAAKQETEPTRTPPARTRAKPKKSTPRTSPSPVGARSKAPVRKVRHDRATLSWKAVPGASYYNLIVWRKGQRVLDLWPSVNRILLPGSWTYQGTERTLSSGRYLWFVYPGAGARADARYGEPVQSGILVIDRK